MVRLTYNNLDEETQDFLLTKSKNEVVRKFGDELQKYAIENSLNFENLLEEEAIRNLYSYEFSFHI